MTIPEATIRQAIGHLRRVDPLMKGLIDRVGDFQLTLQRNRFASLARAIVAQQISSAAARTIWKRLQNRVAPRRISPVTLLELSTNELRAVGLSQQKASYVTDLARKSADGTIPWKRFTHMADHEIIEELIAVRGIGRWTAQMFLIFSLGRLDVFAPDDLGLRSAIRKLYGLPDLPLKGQCLRYAEPWSPYASVASWYLWRSLDASV